MMLFGKTILITGVASGIGLATAELARALGADVVGVDLRAPEHPVGVFHQADLSHSEGVAALVDKLPRRIDALCNVAGVSGTIGAVRTLAINFYGLRAVTEAVLPRLREGAVVVNAASIAGYGLRANLGRARALVDVAGFPSDLAALLREHGVVDEGCYPVSKEALLLWTMRAAHDPVFRTRGVRVNAVSPGPVSTPIIGEFRAVLGDARVDSDIARVGGAATAADVAPAIAFLCSDGARWINGANLPVDGGLEASINAEVMGF